MSGIIRTKPIVTNGLIFYLDVANPKSYISGSTTTTDLIGETLGTLRNGVGYDSDNLGYLVFDGIDDDILLTPTTNFNFEWTDAWSIEAWIYAPFTGGLKFAFSKWSGSIPRGWFFRVIGVTGNPSITGVLNFQLRQAGSGYIDAYSTSSINFDQWNHVVLTYDGSGTNAGITFYINNVATTKPNTLTTEGSGTPLGSGSISSGTIQTTEPTTVQSLVDNGNWTEGDLESTKVYNKELSSSEVLQNYNALKYRFT
jgi:hypothetical protein